MKKKNLDMKGKWRGSPLYPPKLSRVFGRRPSVVVVSLPALLKSLHLVIIKKKKNSQ